MTPNSSPIFRWHHRVLGALWGLFGLVEIVNLVWQGSWDVYRWIALSVTSAYVTTGIGLIFGRTWARRIMGVLMVISLLFFLDMLLMSGWVGNYEGVWEILLALGIASYTLLFLAISAAYRSYKDSR